MAKAIRCYYTGRAGLRCEHCPMSDQQYCGNYIPRSPYTKAPEEIEGSPRLSKSKLLRALEQMGFKKS